MHFTTEQAMTNIISSISGLDAVKSIGISGSLSFPKTGEGDIDVFIYCDKVPDVSSRKAALVANADVYESLTAEVFDNSRWGIGDLLMVNGVEVWLMYFAMEAVKADVRSILAGEQPGKIGEEYYPTGRLAMLSTIHIVYEGNGFLRGLKENLQAYPEGLAKNLLAHHLDKLEDTEDLERAVFRREVLLYHFALENKLDHFLQALFAHNHAYFPSRKRTLGYLDAFGSKPADCGPRLLEVVRLGAFGETMSQSYELWQGLVQELMEIVRAAD